MCLSLNTQKHFPISTAKLRLSVVESIKEFHRKVIKFNASVRDCKDFEYSDKKFDDLELLDDEIPEETSKGFLKHCFAGYKSFTKHGSKSDHKNYQMYYLDRAFQRHQCMKRNNKYAIKKGEGRST